MQTAKTGLRAWAAGLLLVCLPLRGYILHGELLLGTGVIDPVYGTAYVGAVLTLVAGALLVHGKLGATRSVTGRVLDRPRRSLVAGVAVLVAIAVLGAGLVMAVEGLSWLAGWVGFRPLYVLVFLLVVVLLAASLSAVVYLTMTMLFGVVFGYLALGRAAVGTYGWPPVIIAGTVFANIAAFVPLASLVIEVGLATLAIGAVVLGIGDPRRRETPVVDPSAR